MDDDISVPIHFDSESRIRMLDPEKFKHTEELAEQCTAFVDKIESFSQTVHLLVEVLDAHAKKIEHAKLKAIGLRNLVESESENRDRKKRALQAAVNEKMAALERENKHMQSLLQIETEQAALIDRLGKNEA